MAQSNNQIAETPKLKIKQTISQPAAIEKEVDLPYFFASKEGFSYYKIISKELAIEVNDFPGQRISIAVRNSVNHFLDNSVEINESSFETAYKSVLAKIQNQNL